MIFINRDKVLNCKQPASIQLDMYLIGNVLL